MTTQTPLQIKQETLYRQIRYMSDRQLRLAVYLIVDGYTLVEAIEFVYDHFLIPKKG